MTRRIMFCCGAALLASPLTAADKQPRAVYPSLKPAAEVAACLSAQIGKFDTPHISPGVEGRTRIVTKIMQVTRIDLTVTANPTNVEVRGKSGKKLRQIIGACL